MLPEGSVFQVEGMASMLEQSEKVKVVDEAKEEIGNLTMQGLSFYSE